MAVEKKLTGGFNRSRFLNDLDKTKVTFTGGTKDSSQSLSFDRIKTLTRDLVTGNVQAFSSVVNPDRPVAGRIFGQVYSRQEIRRMVCKHLIPQYQQDQIIEAVTDFLYSLHASVPDSN